MRTEDVFAKVKCCHCGSVMFAKCWSSYRGFKNVLWFECPNSCSIARIENPWLYPQWMSSEELEMIALWTNPQFTQYSNQCFCGASLKPDLWDDIPSLGHVCTNSRINPKTQHVEQHTLRDLYRMPKYGFIRPQHLHIRYEPKIIIQAVGQRFQLVRLRTNVSRDLNYELANQTSGDFTGNGPVVCM